MLRDGPQTNSWDVVRAQRLMPELWKIVLYEAGFGQGELADALAGCGKNGVVERG